MEFFIVPFLFAVFFIIPMAIRSKSAKNKEADTAKKRQPEAFEEKGAAPAQAYAYKYNGNNNPGAGKTYRADDSGIRKQAENKYAAAFPHGGNYAVNPSVNDPYAVKPSKSAPYAVKPSQSEPYAVKPSKSAPYAVNPAAKNEADTNGLSAAMKNLSPAACGVVWAEIIGKPKSLR